MERRTARPLCWSAFSSREPVSTSLENALAAGSRREQIREALPADAIAESKGIGELEDRLVVFYIRKEVAEVLSHRLAEQDAADQLLGPVLLSEGEGIEGRIFP